MEFRQQSDFQVVLVADGDGDDNETLPPGISVSKFDHSVENHFKVVDKLSMISGESEFEFEESEVQRLASSITFLRRWRDICYQPRAIRFAYESDTQEKNVTARMNLPQFSSAAVPKDMSDGNDISSPLSKDFVMYVGGPIWALDWCPRVHKISDFDTNVEFIAVSAHPPESSYHKIGAPLTGRGLIQIWCLLNTGVKDQDVIPLVKVKPRKNSQRSEDSNQAKRPRGRPRKNPLSESLHNMQPEDSNNLLQIVAIEETVKNSEPSKQQKQRGRPRKKPIKETVKISESLHNMQPENSNNLLQIVAIEETVKNCKPCKQQKQRGRPRKKPIKEPLNDSEFSDNSSPRTSPEPLAVKFPEHSTGLLSVDKISLFTPETVDKDPSQIHPEDGNSGKTHDQVTEKEYKFYTQKRKYDNKEHSTKSMLTSSKSKLTKCQIRKKSKVNGADLPFQSQNCASSLEQDPGLVEPLHNSSLISEDVALPRLVMGLAHNGKVAWDVKWRPSDSHHISKHIMGYLAVLLGNGALEVFYLKGSKPHFHLVSAMSERRPWATVTAARWEVPLPRVTKAIFSSSHEEGTDPRFLLLKPVFVCSMLKCGDRQSIPLTLEWSASVPHDLILAGCHDGVVALWKFTANGPSKETRPLLCFNADTVPIRALKWAPLAIDPESANIIVTAGHKGVKFWDIRDPFHPLWDVPAQSIINSVDWLSDPRCVVLSLDDGEIRLISLLKAACDTCVTGMPFLKTQQYGPHSYYCSSSSIWSVQVSRLGMVAYCCSDGKVIQFQLTTKAVEKDPHRNRAPHYLCCSLAEEESTLTVFSPLPNVPFPMKKSLNKCGDAPISKRGYISTSNQEKRAKEELSKNRTPQKQPSGQNFGSESTSQALVSADNDVKDEQVNVKETLPSKIVAMHRVRWNMNEGSERLLCYGGAAGILRCQKIS